MKSIENCVGEIEDASNPDFIKDLSRDEAKEILLEAYDINNDGNIKWSEYHISNQFLKKHPKTLRAEFKFFDKDQNWVISAKELEKAKPKNIGTFINSGKRK